MSHIAALPEIAELVSRELVTELLALARARFPQDPDLADAGAALSGDGAGFSRGSGPGAGIYAGGGGHGGYGAGNFFLSGYGRAYDSAQSPAMAGSGGSSGSQNRSTFGNGGGALRLNVAGALIVNGILSAD